MGKKLWFSAWVPAHSEGSTTHAAISPRPNIMLSTSAPGHEPGCEHVQVYDDAHETESQPQAQRTTIGKSGTGTDEQSSTYGSTDGNQLWVVSLNDGL